jgi:serine/threonine protein kinase
MSNNKNSSNNESSYYSDSSSSSSDDISSSSDEIETNQNNLELNGDIVGKYNIISELGRGSYSIVWLAFNIEDGNYYAIKIHNPEDFKEGLSEVNIMKKLPKNIKYFNHLKENFIYSLKKNNKKTDRFLCSVYELHCGNIDSFIRKGKYNKGFSVKQSKIFFNSLIQGINVLHNKVKVFHGDIKSDNLLLKGINNKDKKLIDMYNSKNFLKKYSEKKKEFWINKGKKISNIKKMKKDDKLEIRKKFHLKFVLNITNKFNNSYDEKIKYEFDNKYLDNPKIVIADFGDFCEEDEKFDEIFGTRYYRAPEAILLSECDNKVDIWAAGCCLYEFLSGDILFDPSKDRERNRDFYHLLLIKKLCGKFPKKFLKETKFWKDYFDKTGNLKNLKDSDDISQIDWEDKLSFLENNEDKYCLIDLFKKIFIINPKKRISAKEILKHKWFTI